MAYRPVTVATTATQLAGQDLKRRSISLFNNSGADVFFSQNQSITTGNGFVLKAGASVSLVREEGDEPELPLWAVVAAGTADVRVQDGAPDERVPPLQVEVVAGTVA